MKKCFSHPLFYYSFALLGFGGLGLQFWYLQGGEDAKGLLTLGHPGQVGAYLLLALALVLSLISCRQIQSPRIPAKIRSLGTVLAALFFAVAAGSFVREGRYLLFALSALALVSTLYILWAHSKSRRPHYLAYGIFVIYFMLYLLSRYQTYSAEPEISRYVFKILALVSMMMVFYQQTAIRAGVGRFRTYHFWRSMTLFLSLTAIPSAEVPALYLATALWLMLDPGPRAAKGSEPQ